MASFPDQNATKKEKSYSEYGRKVAKAIYDEAKNDSFGFYSRRKQIKDNQLWAEGGHSVDVFKDEIDNGGDMSWLNLNFDTPSPLPHLANTFVGNATNRLFKIQCEALDNQSKSERDAEYRRLMMKMKLKPLENDIRAAGLPVDLEDAPVSKEDVDDEMELNYKAPIEEAIELCTKDVFQASGHEEIQSKIALDVFENNAGATKVYYENGQRKFRHVKLENLVTSYTTFDDYNDMYYVGEVYQMSVADAMQRFPNSEMTKGDWVKVAVSFSGDFGNTPFGEKDYYSGSVTWDMVRSYKVQVMDFEYKVNNTYRWKDKKTRKNTRIIDKVSEEYDPSGKHNTEVVERELADIYEGIWVVNTEHMLRWRLKPNMTRKIVDGKIYGDTDFSYTIYKPNSRDMVNKSLCELIKPHAKQIIIYNLKIMQMVMEARPSGAFVDVSALGQIAMGMGDPSLTTTDPNEFYASFNQSGLMLYSSMREDGSVISNSNPIVPYEGGVSNGIQNLLILRDSEMQQIYRITGFNPAVDGSATSKDAAVGIEKIRVNSFNITMKPYFDSIDKIITDTAAKVAEQEKDWIVADKEYAKRVAEKIGKEKVDVIKLIKDATLCQLGISILFQPEEEDAQKFQGYLLRSLERDQITSPDAINAEEIAKTNLKGAITYLKKAIRKKSREDAELANQASQANAQSQMQSNQQAEALKIESMKVEYALKTRYMFAEKSAEAALKESEHDREAALKILQAELDEHLIEIAAMPDPNTDTISNKMGGESNVHGRVRKSAVKGNTAARKTGGGNTIPQKAGGAPRVGKQPQDDAIVNARPQ